MKKVSDILKIDEISSSQQGEKPYAYETVIYAQALTLTRVESEQMVFLEVTSLLLVLLTGIFVVMTRLRHHCSVLTFFYLRLSVWTIPKSLFLAGK